MGNKRKLLEIGARFGRLVVIERAPNVSGQTAYRCQCDCGKDLTVRATELRTGNTKSCGCIRRRPLKIGARFGKLVVVDKAVPIGPHTAYKCQCDCGNVLPVRATVLRHGKRTSCGCAQRKLLKIGARFDKLVIVERAEYHRPQTAYKCRCDCGNVVTIRARALRGGQKYCKRCKGLPSGEAGFRQLLVKYKQGAERRGLPFWLTEDEFRELVTGHCFYCGILPHTILERRNTYGNFTYNGIDRKDNALGYEKGNVVSCCKQCNFNKSDMGYNEWMEYVVRLTEFQHQKKEESDGIMDEETV